MVSEHERFYDLGMDALVIACTRTWRTTMVVYAVFWALETLRMCGPCHAGHIRKGRPRTHFLRVYAPAEPRTILVAIASNKGGNNNTDNWQ